MLLMIYFTILYHVNHGSYADVMPSAIGFTIFTVLLGSWSLTFLIGGEQLFGPAWNDLVMYNLADKLGLTGWT